MLRIAPSTPQRDQIKAPVLTIFGQRENGKSLLANLLHERLLPEIYGVCTGFAHKLKRVVADVTGQDMDYLDSIKTTPDIHPEDWDCGSREAFQLIGESFRKIDNRCWIKYTLRGTDGYNKERALIIDDGRHWEEAQEVKKVGGWNVLIVRLEKFNDDIHPSEKWIGEIAKEAYKLLLNGGNLRRSFSMFDEIVFNDEGIPKVQMAATDIARKFKRWVLG